MKDLKIFLIDDHTLFREGLKFLLSNLTFVSKVYEASNGKDFLELLKSNIPDIVLLDIEMPVLDGIDATRLAIEQYPELKIIALSMYSDESYYQKMIDSGAKGFLLKNSPFQEVEDAIKEVYNGNYFFSKSIVNDLINNLNKKRNSIQNKDLTQREIEILYNICKGLSNQEISEILFISKRTVDKHRENLLSKTNSKNTADLVVYAIKNGIFEV